MTHCAVTVFGVDRPGIVATLTEALFEAGANLEDVASTILRGHFAMMMVVEAPRPPSELEARVAAAMEPLGVSAMVREVETGGAETAPPTHALSVYGSDRPGIVARFSRTLADVGGNITDLSCRRVGGPGAEVYAMVAEVSLPPGSDPSRLDSALRSLAEGLGVDMTLAPIEPDVL